MTCPDCEALRLRAEAAEARIESISGLTREALVQRERDRLAPIVEALEAVLWMAEKWADAESRSSPAHDAVTKARSALHAERMHTLRGAP